MKKVHRFMLLAALFAPALFATPAARAQAPPPAPQAAAPAPAGVRVEAPKFLPEVVTGGELKDLAGQPFRLSDLRGRVYVLNLWATWCGPCRLEIPGLNKVYEDYRGRGVEFVGLTTEDPSEDAEKVRSFARETPISYRVGWLDREAALALNDWSLSLPSRRGFALPQTFVVGADGHVVLHVRGYNPKVPDMIRAGVEKALGEADGAAPPPSAPAGGGKPAGPQAPPAP